jgi:hypothetical protein
MVSSKLYRYTAIVSGTFVLLSFALPAWRIVPIAQSQPYLPLHYNIYFGIDRFGPWYFVFFPAALGAALLLVNLGFEAVFFRREHVLSKFFAVATVFSEVVLFIAVVLIVLLNI